MAEGAGGCAWVCIVCFDSAGGLAPPQADTHTHFPLATPDYCHAYRNLNPRTIPRKHGPKIQYDYFYISDLRNIPATHQPLIAGAWDGWGRKL